MISRTVLFAGDDVAPAALPPALVVDAETEVEEGVTTTHLVDEQARVEVVLTVDRLLPAAYAVVTADDAATLAAALAELGALGVVDREAQRARVAAASGAPLGTELLRLAVLARDDGWDPAELDHLRRGLADHDAAVRADAAMAIGLRPDPALRGDVERALVAETDDEAGAVLAQVVDMLSGA